MWNLLFRTFVKNHTDVENPSVREGYGVFCGIVGIICNLLLCTVKIIVGSLFSSISVVADGLNNLSDMGSSIISMVGFKLANKPADRDHPFGHGRMEYMSAFIVAVLIMFVGVELLTSSITALTSGDAAPKYSIYSAAVLLVSVAVKLFMFLLGRKAGKTINSQTLLATAQDSINDVIASSVILVSVVLGMFITLPFNLDAVMGIGVAVFILYSGFCSGKQTLDEILGQPAPRELLDEIHKIIMSFDGFLGTHDLIVHNYGPGRQFASVHVEVSYNNDIVHCHEQMDLCEKLVEEKLGIILVIHMDPIDVENEYVMHTRSQIALAVAGLGEGLTIHDFRMTPKGDERTNLIFDVVVPSNLNLSHEELQKQIGEAAKKIDPTFCCVITFDSDFTAQ